MTAVRGVAIGALLLAAVLVAVLLFGGDQRTKYKVRFANAGQLVKDDDVQVGGRRVGTISSIKLTVDNQAEIDIAVDPEFAPLREGTRAVIRATSLSGIANRYIALTPGPNNARELEEGATAPGVRRRPTSSTSTSSSTRSTRRRAARCSTSSRARPTSSAARATRPTQAAKYFNPTLSTTRRLVNEINRDSRTLQRFIIDGAKAMTALSPRSAPS